MRALLIQQINSIYKRPQALKLNADATYLSDKRHLQAPASLLNYPVSLHVQQLNTAYKTSQTY